MYVKKLYIVFLIHQYLTSPKALRLRDIVNNIGWKSVFQISKFFFCHYMSVRISILILLLYLTKDSNPKGQLCQFSLFMHTCIIRMISTKSPGRNFVRLLVSLEGYIP